MLTKLTRFIARLRRLLPRNWSDVLMGGETIREIETPLATRWSSGSLTVQLKRHRRTSNLYVVLACQYPGNLQYYLVSLEEFEEFAGNVRLLLGDLRVTQRATGFETSDGSAGVATSGVSMMSADSLRTIDTTVWHGLCNLSLRLKRDPASSELHVVLVCTGGSGTWLYALTAGQYEQFASAVRAIRDDVRPLVHPSLQARD